MCDADTLQDTIEYQLRGGLSRRHFGALTLGAGLTTMLAPIVRGDELAVTESDVEIHTPDGTADAYFVHPSKGSHPAVLLWPDIFGLRPAFRQMGKRLAGSGYSVLAVNPYYRNKRAPVVPEHADFEDPATRDALMALRGTLTPATTQTDAVAFVQWLDANAMTLDQIVFRPFAGLLDKALVGKLRSADEFIDAPLACSGAQGASPQSSILHCTMETLGSVARAAGAQAMTS
jgi:hypothetical protein